MWIETASAIACLIFAFVIMGLFSSNKFNVNGRTAIVTGGSQGLGLSLAKQLAAKGANVVIVAQNVSKLELANKQIEKSAIRSEQRFLHLSFDLRSSESAPRILKQVSDWNGGKAPEIVINCAGNCLPGFFATSSIDTLHTQMNTVYWTCAYMAHATLQLWTKSSNSNKTKTPTSTPPRHLIFVSSVVAFFPLAGYSPYSPAKAAMRALADSLYQEAEVYNGARLHSEGGPDADIKVHIAFPMGIKSPGYENEQTMKPELTKLLEEDDIPQDPDVLAKDLISGLEQGQFMLTSTFIGKLMKGWAMASSPRTTITDYLWSWLGSLVILIISPLYLAKCRKWGKEKGMLAAR